VSERALEAQPRMAVDLDGVILVWQRHADGHVTVRRADTGAELLSQRMFWFAWYSFNTDTALWDTGGGD
jgi:ammonia channel protein AmtB